ncbi:MAG TPA: cytochrome c [Pseudomonadales bacterium]|nr:cytochrome c [Pseudomonadales bacterium]
MRQHSPRPDRLRSRAGACALVALLAGGALPTAAESDLATLIDARQTRFEEMGEAFKVFRDELRSDEPEVAVMPAAAEVIVSYAGHISEWFPAGSGPESGLETDALAYIWKNTDKFARIDADLVPAAAALQAAVATGEVGAITAEFSTVGRTCKACHDSFRAD